MNTPAIRSAVAADLATLSHTHLDITIKWSKRFTKTFAEADVQDHVITFGTRTFALLDPEMQRETIAHEVAHIVAFARWGRLSLSDGHHGTYWRAVMTDLGYPDPDVVVDPRRLPDMQAFWRMQRKLTRWVVECACRRRMWTKRNAVTSYRWRCNRCDETLVATGEMVKVSQ
jgi:predicted SprT family Zn-dependent metalloprotease